MARIIFIPWIVNHEQFKKCLKWQRQAAIHKHKLFHVVHYSPFPNPVLLLTTKGEIYIRGHGAANDPEIAPGSGAIGGDLRFDAVGDRLIKTGLRKAFAGKIKCWNCHSGVSGATSFAKQFADYMRSRGYTNCTYWGYLDALDSFYYRGVDGEYHRFAGDGSDEAARAKNNQIQV